MTYRVLGSALAGVMVLALLGVAGWGGEAQRQPEDQLFRLLIVDGTKSLEATLRVLGLANAIQRSGRVEVTVLLSEDMGSFADPLENHDVPEIAYDVILLIPTDVDRGTAYGIWILVSGDPQATPERSQAVMALRLGVEEAFLGLSRALGVYDDLWAAVTAALYTQQGWLR